MASKPKTEDVNKTEKKISTEKATDKNESKPGKKEVNRTEEVALDLLKNRYPDGRPDEKLIPEVVQTAKAKLKEFLGQFKDPKPEKKSIYAEDGVLSNGHIPKTKGYKQNLKPQQKKSLNGRGPFYVYPDDAQRGKRR